MKKSAYTLIICIILLSSNITLLTLTQNIIQQPTENIETNEDTYQIIYIVDQINPRYQSFQLINYEKTASFSNCDYDKSNYNSNHGDKTPFFIYHVSMKYDISFVDNHCCFPNRYIVPCDSTVSF